MCTQWRELIAVACVVVVFEIVRPHSDGNLSTIVVSGPERVPHLRSARLRQAMTYPSRVRYREVLKNTFLLAAVTKFDPVSFTPSTNFTSRRLMHPGELPLFFLTPVPRVESFSIAARWSALRSLHRLLSDSPSGCTRFVSLCSR